MKYQIDTILPVHMLYNNLICFSVCTKCVCLINIELLDATRQINYVYMPLKLCL